MPPALAAAAGAPAAQQDSARSPHGSCHRSVQHDCCVAEKCRPWLDSWVESAYGPAGFWSGNRPQDHFRTASATGPHLAEALGALLAEHPRVETVVELGAGDGRLLTELAARRPDLLLAGVDLRARPDSCSPAVDWRRDLWDVTTADWSTGAAAGLLDSLTGPALVVAVEWLDDLPCPVAARQTDGDTDPVRLVEVAPSGRERLGTRPTAAELSWSSRWWPSGNRLEIGTTRDRAWAAALSRLTRHGGLGLAVDYGHLRAARPAEGSLTGYCQGRAVPARPSPDLNLTAAVAMDALAETGHRLGATTLLLQRQAEVLRRPVAADGPAGPVNDLDTLVRRSQRAALVDERVWGGQWWLLQQVPAHGWAPPGRAVVD